MPAKNNAPRLIAYRGRKLTLEAWAAETKIPQATLRARLDRLGWTVERALSTPADPRFARGGGRPAKGAVRSAPKLKRHARGLAYCRWMENGKRRQKWFGPWGSPEARERYARFLREWSAAVESSQPMPEARATSGTVGELVERWLDYCTTRYVKHGRKTSEYHCHRAAALTLGRFAGIATRDFGLSELEAVRGDMIAKGWARRTINNHIARIIAAFGWGVPRRLVPTETHYALQQIQPLAAGATTAPESVPVRSVPAKHIEALLVGDHLHPDPARRAILAAMIRVQLLTGMRPGELCAMRPEHIDRTGQEWRYSVPDHANKNLHRDQARVVWIGPRAQAILSPLIDAAEARGHSVFAFVRERSKKLPPRPIPRLEYNRLITAACKRAGVPHWYPHRLRHNKATDVKRLYESDSAAARAIGTTPDVAARIYADPHEAAARRIARATG